jgi:hypothetical protein
VLRQLKTNRKVISANQTSFKLSQPYVSKRVLYNQHHHSCPLDTDARIKALLTPTTKVFCKNLENSLYLFQRLNLKIYSHVTAKPFHSTLIQDSRFCQVGPTYRIASYTNVL